MRYTKNILGFLLFLVLVPILGITAQAYTEDVTYIDRSWNGSEVVSETKTANCLVVDYSTELICDWFAVTGDVYNSNRIHVIGTTANLILCDGAKLSVLDGIRVNAGQTLNIYCQSGGTGELYCEADTNDNAAIGSDDHGGDCGTINIYGGIITADTYKNGEDAAGIGGGQAGSGGKITIYDGTVIAKGGSSSEDGGAGIGGGGDGGNGGTITIYGGNVTATGGGDGAGIGGGDEGSGGDISIYGGTVNATGGNKGAGIGGGDADGDGKSGGHIRIYGGTVTAKGGSDSAGIGGGEGCGAGTIEIFGGTVNATGGSKYDDGGAGIGSGDKDGKTFDIGQIKISGGNVTALGGANGAGIGGGEDVNGGIIDISGGTVYAKGGIGYAGIVWNGSGAGIGGGDGCDGGTINISGGKVTAELDTFAESAAIGGGYKGTCGHITISGGDVTANVRGAGGSGIGVGKRPNKSAKDETIRITGGTIRAEGSSGIGGHDKYGPGRIEISNATVTAKGNGSGAGIGSGPESNSVHIIIENSTIDATGGLFSAAIGGGDGTDNDLIEIRTSTVQAVSGIYGSGIGGGMNANGGTVRITNSSIKAMATTQKDEKGSAIGAGADISHDKELNNGTVEFFGDTVIIRAGENSDDMVVVKEDEYKANHVQHYVEINTCCTVTYDANGATGGVVPMDEKIYGRGDKVTLIGNSGELEKPLNSFAGWNTKADGSGVSYKPGDSFTINSSTTLYAKWDSVPTSYLDWDASGLVEMTCNDLELFTSDATVLDDGKWYAVYGEVNSRSRITVKGTAHLIILDGAKLNAAKGITVEGNSHLIIHGQNGQTGTFNAKGIENAAAIGGGGWDLSGGSVTINGCSVTAEGGEHGAGIGGGRQGNGGVVTINGGTVNAIGGFFAAGIGGGDGDEVFGTDGGKVIINGGTVRASGGKYAVGIGGSFGISNGDLYVSEAHMAYSSDAPIQNTSAEGVIQAAGKGSETPVSIERKQYLLVEKESSVHTHNFTYSANSATITATCSNTEDSCTLADRKVSLTIIEPSENASLESGNAGATLSGLESFNKETQQTVAESSIRYIGRGNTTYAESEIPPTDVGTYTAKITLANVKTEGGDGGSVTASVDYEIKKTGLVTTDKEKSVPAVVVANNSIYSGTEKPLVTVIGDAIGGTMYYAQGENSTTAPADDIYDTSIPSGSEVGTYYVWYKVVGDDNHFDTESKCTVVAIYDQNTLFYNGKDQELVKEGAVEGGTFFYTLGSDDVTAPAETAVWSEEIPTGKEVAEYFVWYKVNGDDNHNDAEPKCVKVAIVPDGQVDGFKEMLKELPEKEEVTSDDKNLVVGLRTIYDALSEKQKSLISEEELMKLTAAEAKIAEIDEATVERFTSAVNAVLGNKAGEGKALFDAATEIKEQLTEAQLALVKQETLDLYEEEMVAFAKGRVFRSGSAYYRVLSNGDVTYLYPADRSVENATVPNQVKKGKFFFKVIKVSNNAFRNCNKLKSVIISENIYVLGERIFARTDNLASVRIMGSGFKSGKVANAFYRAGNIKLTLPGSKVSEYEELFRTEGKLSDKSTVVAA